MTDEEKKAFKVLENFRRELGLYANGIQINRGFAIETILNLIEKQSKEIEELKEDRDKFKKALGKRITYCNELEKDLFENCSNYVVSKDKIKAKIEEVDYKMIAHQDVREAVKQVLQSLLEKE